MPKVIFYRRISISRVDSESLEAQRERLVAWAQREGHEVVGDFCDDGLTGKTMDTRPAALAALDMACRHRGSVLAVASLSRLGRSTKDVIDACERLTRAGCGFVSLNEAFDITTPSGRLLVAVLGAVAQWERETIAERTTQTMARMRRSHRRISGVVPYGWNVGLDDAILVENPTEQTVLVEMGNLRTSGLSFDRIAADFNARFIPAKRGGAWSGRAVRLVLERQTKLVAVA